MDKDFFGLSGTFQIIGVLRKSKARYAQGLEAGDIIHVRMKFSNLSGGYGQGNYVQYLTLHLYNKHLGEPDDFASYEEFSDISQNDFFKTFKKEVEGDQLYGVKPIFLIRKFD